LGDDKDSRIEVLSDRAEATFRVLFKDENREPLDILMEEFIDDKSARAKGKRVTTLEVASIEDITPAPPEPEVSPDETGETLEEEGFEEPTDIPEEPEKIEVEGVTMTFEKPKDTQLDLF
jgi:topoisomerase-4 subunit A